MRKFIRASVLVLALTFPAFAGDIPYGVTSAPPPAPIAECGDIPNGATGYIPNGVTGEIPFGETSEPTFLEVLLSLFSLI
jgi:hypothetical protein